VSFNATPAIEPVQRRLYSRSIVPSVRPCIEATRGRAIVAGTALEFYDLFMPVSSLDRPMKKNVRDRLVAIRDD
jgi:hypothetical protein